MNRGEIFVESFKVPAHGLSMFSRLLSEAIHLICMAKRGRWNLLGFFLLENVLTVLRRLSYCDSMILSSQLGRCSANNQENGMCEDVARF